MKSKAKTAPQVRVRFARNIGIAMSVDLNKPLQTRSGAKARLLGIITGAEYSHVFAVTNTATGGEYILSRYPTGLAGDYCTGPGDIINAPEVTERFGNVYKDPYEPQVWHATKKDVDFNERICGRIGLIKVTLTDGVPTKVELV
jgi:hypothetical protein